MKDRRLLKTKEGGKVISLKERLEQKEKKEERELIEYVLKNTKSF